MIKRTKIKVFFTLVIFAWMISATTHIQAQPFLPNYDQRFNFTVEADRVSGDQTVIIRLRLGNATGIGLTDVSAIFDEIGGDYGKIAITNSSGTDEFEVEVSRWDVGNEEGEIWFRAPIDAATDTTFYFYYDGDVSNNTNVKDPGGASTVWLTATDEQWLRVYHLSENAGNFIDSSNTFNVTDSSVTLRQQEGRNGSYAVDFDNVNPDYLNIGDMNLEGYDNLSFILMAYSDDSTHGSSAIIGNIPTGDQFLIYVPAGTTNWRAFMYDDGFRDDLTTDMDNDEWANVFVTYELNTNPGWILYVADDDQTLTNEDQSLTDAGNMDPPNPANTPVGVGSVASGGDLVLNDLPWDGLIDEVWIANYTFTESTLDIFSYGLFDDLINWGAAESAPAGPGAPAATALVNLRFITALGVGIENVAVSMENDTDTIFDVLTNSTGYIPEQNITQANITLAALHDDYSDYIHIYEVNESISWVIRLGTGEEEMPGIVLLIFAGLSLITFIGMLVAQSLAISVSSAVVSFVCWSVTALYYLYENSAFPGPSVLFMLFAAISFMYAVYAGLQLISPYRRQELEDGV